MSIRSFIALLLAGAAAAQAQPLAQREQLNAVVWQQRSTEYRGNALQAWRHATGRLPNLRTNGLTASLEQRAAGGFRNKPVAVVLDVDETVLDNTPFNANLLREGRGFDLRDWDQWVREARAAAVPGAREFVQRARTLGFRVVFVTNRNCNREAGYDAQGRALDCPQKAATLANLEAALGSRPAAADLLLRDEQQGRDDSDKRARRIEVARTHRIALAAGDDLNDFIRAADYVAAEHSVFWGANNGGLWVALPNPIYGSWERGIESVAQKYAALQAWTPSPLPPSARLSIVAWNLAWLADPALLDSSGFWTRCAAQGFPNEKLRDDLPFCDVYKRQNITNAQEYAAGKLAPLRTRLAELAAAGMDVLAVQETGSAGALQAVLPPGYAITCFTTRVDAQNLGFAVRTAANLQLQCREVRSLSQEDNPAVTRPVRRGLELVVGNIGGSPARRLALLNVHLKAACPAGRLDGSNGNCVTLRAQTPALEAWIEEQGQAGRPFAVIGDWNRDLDAELAGGFPARSDGSDPSGPIDVAKLRNLWPEINDGTPAASAMTLALTDRSVAGVTPSDAPLDTAELMAEMTRESTVQAGGTCHAKLDQMAFSLSLRDQLARSSLAAAGRVPAALLARPPGSSDHCPLRVELLYR
jgi:5'-nucleotidase (lipoprotein e(P4) family)